MAGFYSEYFDGTNYIPCSFFKWNGSSDEQVYQITYFNGSSDVVIGDLPSSSMMVDGYFDWNVPGASFVVGVGTLADVKDITDLLLGQISVCPKVLNSLKFHRFTSFSSVESAGTKCNEQRKTSGPESFQKV